MSLFSKVFGKSKPKANSANQSINQMKETVEILEKREALLMKKIDMEVTRAKEFMAKKNKQAALLCLKKKKTYEEQLARIGNQKIGIETMYMKVEEATIDMETLTAQKNGADSLKAIYAKRSIDKIENELDQVRDAMETANEISQVISQGYTGVDVDMDEDELLNELEGLEEEDLAERMIGTQTSTLPNLSQRLPPTVTTTNKSPQKKTPQQEEEDQFAELEASL